MQPNGGPSHFSFSSLVDGMLVGAHIFLLFEIVGCSLLAIHIVGQLNVQLTQVSNFFFEHEVFF
jgi:hypothetical protein